MAFLAILVYIALALLQPWTGYPELANLRMMLWLMIGISLVLFMQVVSGKVSLWVPQIPILGVFLLLTALSIAVTGWFGGGALAATQVMVPLTACIALIGNVNSLSRIRWLARVLVFVGAYFSVRAILAIEFGIDLATYGYWEAVGYDEFGEIAGVIYRARALGVLRDPNDLAQYLVACLPLAVLLWTRGRMVANMLQVAVPVSLMGGAIYLTRSRGGLIGLAFLMVAAASRISKLVAPLAGVGLVVGVLAFGFSGGRETSIGGGTGGGRIEVWTDTLNVARAHPVFGVGYGNIEDNLEGITAHNSYLLCLAEIGVPGLFFWLAAFSFTFFQLWTVLFDTQISQETRRACRLCLAALGSGMVTATFLSRTYALTLYIFLGAAIAAFLVAREEQAEPVPIFRFKWLLWNGLTMFLLVGVFYGIVRLKWLLG